MFQWVSVARPRRSCPRRDILHSGVQRGEAKEEQGSERDTGGERKKISFLYRLCAQNSCYKFKFNEGRFSIWNSLLVL